MKKNGQITGSISKLLFDGQPYDSKAVMALIGLKIVDDKGNQVGVIDNVDLKNDTWIGHRCNGEIDSCFLKKKFNVPAQSSRGEKIMQSNEWTMIDDGNPNYNRWRRDIPGTEDHYVESFFKGENPNVSIPACNYFGSDNESDSTSIEKSFFNDVMEKQLNNRGGQINVNE